MVPKAILPGRQAIMQEIPAIMQQAQAITAGDIQAMKDGTAMKAGTIIQPTEGITLITARLITATTTIIQATIITPTITIPIPNSHQVDNAEYFADHQAGIKDVK